MKTEYKPLSKRQKAALAQLARAAYEELSRCGATDLPFTEWRRSEQEHAVGCDSLTKCQQRDFLPLRAHFNSLLGRDDKAFTDHLKSQPSNDHTTVSDTPEKREQIIARIKKELNGNKYNLGYVRAIARNKHKTTNLNNLTATQLTQLLMTTKSRVAKSS